MYRAQVLQFLNADRFCSLHRNDGIAFAQIITQFFDLFLF